MAIDEQLADRVRELLVDQQHVVEKKMFQGICFMVDDKMCVCVRRNDILCRIGAEQAQKELEKGECMQMLNNGRVMKDYVFIESARVQKERDLTYWIDLCLRFNPEAKSSKKRK
jgi:TfoX/Sxy family transcriptional regulator of competence genes